MSTRKNILFQLNLIYIFLIFFGFAIIGKVIYLQFFYDKELIAKITQITTRYSEITPNRGEIYSSDGRLLATSVPYFEVGIDLNCDGLRQDIFNENVDSLAYQLSKMFPHKTKGQFKQELINRRDSGSRYYRFASSLDYENFKKMQNFPLLRLGQFTGGFVYRKHSKRERPFGNLARRTIGTVETDFQSGVGLEVAFNEYLQGTIGYTVMQRISGNMWMPVSDFNHIEPQDGYDLITTIDISMQDIAETALKKQLQHHEAKFGTVVLMEVSTGKVKAIVNLTRTDSGNYIEDYNYAVGRASDPGSTFKLASVIAALEDGYIEPTHLVETGNGIHYYHGIKMEDVLKGGYGTISIQKSFEVSSNVGISKIIHENYRHQPEKFINRLYKLNLNDPLGLAIQGEPSPLIPYPGESQWSGISLTQISVGYEVQLTPFQVLAFYNAIANNGCMVKPIFAEEVRFRGNTVKSFQPEIINPSITSQQTLTKAKIMLEGVIENGTARSIKSDNFKIAGKTGTAQMNYGRVDEKNEYHASFAGYFPADNPKYSMVVSIYKPQINGYYGSVVAAPVFKEIAEKLFASCSDFYKDNNDREKKEGLVPVAQKSYRSHLSKVYEWLEIKTNLNSISNTDWVSGTRNDSTPKYGQLHFSDKTRIPNVLSMGLSDAIVIIENLGLDVKTHGRGKVIRQVPAPGANIGSTQTVELFLDV